MSIDKTTFDDLLIQVRRIEEHRRKGAEIEIKRCYQQLVKDLQEFLGVEYARLAEDDKLTYVILQQKGEQARLLEEVERKINGITPKAAAEIRSVVNDVYAVAYSGMVKAVNTSTSTTQLHKTLKGLPLVSPEVVKRAVENPINKLTLNDRLERNRKDVIYNIKREIGTGLAQGDRMSTMAKRITEQVDIDYRKAMTITRTEVHRVQEAGHCDSARDISSALDKGHSGMVMAKTWRTIQDESVRPQRQPYRRKKGVKARKKATAGLRSYIGGPNHVKMEGVTVKADELFDLGGGVTADTPGQSGVAGHDINCRCYASYSLMTVAEFEKVTSKSYEKSLTGEVDGGIMEETGEDNIVTKEVDLTDKAAVKAALDEFEGDYKDKLTSTTLVLEQKGSGDSGFDNTLDKLIPTETAAQIELKKRFENDISVIPQSHKDILNSTVNSVIITTDKPSGYNASKKILRINENFSKGHMIHESGHVIADYFKVYEDSEFVEVLRSGLEEIDEVITDTTTFVESILRLQGSKFISAYQARVYEDESLIENGNLNAYALREYFSEGYREFFENADYLKSKDLKLHEYIRKLVNL